MSVSTKHILQRLHDSEINWELSCFYDGVFTWRLGDSMNGYKDQGNAESFDGAVAALEDAARRHYPQLYR